MSYMNRRDFFKSAALALAALATLPAVGGLFSPLARAAENFVSPTDPVAKALGYHEDATQVKDKKKFPKKFGKDGKTQVCKNCSFYTAVASKNGGNCTMISAGLVKEGAWCNSWNKKA